MTVAVSIKLSSRLDIPLQHNLCSLNMIRALITLASVLHWSSTSATAFPTHDADQITRRDISQVTPGQWESLNASVNGRLFAATPQARPCYGSYKAGLTSSTVPNSVNAAFCLANNQNSTKSEAIVGNFGSYQTTNFAGCMALNQDCPQTTLGLPSLLGTCSQGSVPSYYIDVREPEDAVAGLAFARTHAVPLVIKNTGHDYVGRSSGPGSLALWYVSLCNSHCCFSF